MYIGSLALVGISHLYFPYANNHPYVMKLQLLESKGVILVVIDRCILALHVSVFYCSVEKTDRSILKEANGGGNKDEGRK